MATFPQDGADVQHLLVERTRPCTAPRPVVETRRDLYASARARRSRGANEIAVELRRGLRRGQLHVLFQPTRELVTGRLVDMALVRWDHPDRERFCRAPLAGCRGDGLGCDAVDRWVLAEACRQDSPSASATSRLGQRFLLRRLRRGDLTSRHCGHSRRDRARPSAARARIERAESCSTRCPMGSARSPVSHPPAIALALDDFGAGYTSWSSYGGSRVSQLEDRPLPDCPHRSVGRRRVDGRGGDPIRRCRSAYPSPPRNRTYQGRLATPPPRTGLR